MNKNSLGSSISCSRRWGTPILSRRRTSAHRQTPSAKGLAVCMVPVDRFSVLCCRVLVSWDEPWGGVWLSTEAGKAVLSLAWDDDASRTACASSARRAGRLVWRWERGGLAYARTRSGNFGPGARTRPRRADCRRLRTAGLEIVGQRRVNTSGISGGTERAI